MALQPFAVTTDLGTRTWHADNAEHAAEQSRDAFPDEPVLDIRPSDTWALDAIATLLGTAATWSGADMLEAIADIIGHRTERPHPGDAAHTYTVDFQEATGRECPEEYVAEDDDVIGAV